MKEWYLNLPNKVRAAIHTTWIAFVAQFAPSLFGWIHEVQEWAGDTSRSFPAVSPIGKLAAAAVVSAVAGALNLVFRSIVPPPQYPTTHTTVVPPAAGERDDGEVTIGLLFLIFAAVAFVIVGLMGANWFIHGYKSPPVAWLGFGLAAYVLAALLPAHISRNP